MICRCGKPMENLGNVNGVVFASCPPQWDEMHVCHECKVKRNVRRRDSLYTPSLHILDGYTEWQPEDDQC
jgi:hypothetical protein